MGIIIEPEGIDFIVDSRPLNEIEDKQNLKSKKGLFVKNRN